MFFRRKKKLEQSTVPLASSDYRIIDLAEAKRLTTEAWEDPQVVQEQDAAYKNLLEEAYRGEIREDFQAAAEAVRRTAIADPHVLEVGCGSGYYFEILSHLLERRIRYVGLDYSKAMTKLAVFKYPAAFYVTGDATKMPFAEKSFDVVLNGVSLMHTLDYAAAIAESGRVARAWCIYHTLPALRHRPTSFLQKRVYGGGLVIEIIFNEQELLELFKKNRLKVRQVIESIPYDLKALLNEPTTSRTYVCEVG